MSDIVHGPTLDALLEKLDRDDTLLAEDAAGYLRALRAKIELLEAEIERMRAERDEWKAKWIALAQASMILTGKEGE